MIHPVLAFTVRTFLTLFVVMDPIGLGPVFLGLAGNRATAERRRLARRAVMVAGGILLFRIAIDMVFAQLERETEEEEQEARSRRDISVFPLGIPLIAGPGTLASVLILAGEAHGKVFGLAIVLAVAALVLGLVYLGLLLSERTAALLGQTGVNVITRVFGILLAALAVQYVADGVHGLFFPA